MTATFSPQVSKTNSRQFIAHVALSVISWISAAKFNVVQIRIEGKGGGIVWETGKKEAASKT